jgi:hypothetical protein
MKCVLYFALSVAGFTDSRSNPANVRVILLWLFDKPLIFLGEVCSLRCALYRGGWFVRV